MRVQMHWDTHDGYDCNYTKVTFSMLSKANI